MKGVKLISFLELLEDPIFREWLKKKPIVTVPGVQRPWRLYIKLDGKQWARKEFALYASAYNYLLRRIKAGGVQDAAIHSKRQPFKPPVVKVDGKKRWWPMPPGHRWCGLCRRPTKFAHFRKHHALPVYLCSPYEKRCSICGVREESTKLYPTPLRSRFM